MTGTKLAATMTRADMQRATSASDGVLVTTWRLGCAEEAILRELQRSGGPVPRTLLLGVVYATSRSAPWTGRSRRSAGDQARIPQGRARQHTESTLSRALRSLERKGLVRRVDNRATRQLLVSLPYPPPLPAWERDARMEEDLAVQWDAASAELAELARRARTRAIRLRLERRSRSAVRERERDLELGAHLTLNVAASASARQGGMTA